MSTNKIGNFNYLVNERDGIPPRELMAKIAAFSTQHFNSHIAIITKDKFTTGEFVKMFGNLSSSCINLITFHYCKNYNVVLEKLLELDTELNILKVLIIQSLHQWYNSTTSIDKVPSIYSTIIAAAQDLVNTNSRILGEPCYSFITSKPDELPVNIIEIFYEATIDDESMCLEELFESS